MKPEKADLIETDLIAGFQGLRGAGSEEMVAKGYKLLITRQISSKMQVLTQFESGGAR